MVRDGVPFVKHAPHR